MSSHPPSEVHEPAREATEAKKHAPRQLIAASIGNVVEWYDWYAYSFLAVYFSVQIFPENESDLTKLLNAFAVFAVGFFMRPVGGLVMGAVADRLGRKTALTATILLMGLGGLILGLTPTYAQAGLLAPIMLVIARLIQGLSVGGEFAASSTFIVESAPEGRRGLFSSFQYVSTTIGQILASGLAALLAFTLSEASMGSWGWRIPFFVGALLSLVGFWIRRGAHETHVDFEDLQAGRKQRPGLFDAIRFHPGASLLIIGITIAGTITYYTWTTYLPTYAQTYAGVGKQDALLAGTLALIFFGLLQPLGGLLSDRIGRRPMLITFAAAFILLTVPGLSFLDDSFGRLLLVQCAGMIFLTGYTSIAAAVNAETIPARVRASGIGFPYSIAVALFGGTAPYVGTLFKSWDRPELFPWYVSGLCVISLIVYILLKEGSRKPLP